MAIENYSFGHIRIDGKDYNADVIIHPQWVRDRWWRKQGHNLCLEDLTEVLQEPPAVLVIGTGYYGRMQVPQDTLDALQAQGLDMRVHPTSEAVTEFNRLQREMARVVAALHLTC